MIGQWKGFDRTQWNVLCRSASPIVRTRNGKLCPIFNVGRNQHGLIAREDGLTERNVPLGFVLASYITGPIYTIGLDWERFLNGSAFVAVKSSVLRPVSTLPPT